PHQHGAGLVGRRRPGETFDAADDAAGGRIGGFAAAQPQAEPEPGENNPQPKLTAAGAIATVNCAIADGKFAQTPDLLRRRPQPRPRDGRARRRAKSWSWRGP